MKKIISITMALCLLFIAAACGTATPGPGAASGDFPGIIAIVTNTIDQNEEEFRSAEALVQRFGEDRVIHRTWPVYFATEPEMMVTILTELASNLDVGAIIINQGVVNTNAAIDAAREIRGDDIFIAVWIAGGRPCRYLCQS